MTTITAYLNEAVTQLRGWRLATAVPKEAEIHPNEYYLILKGNQWQLRYWQAGRVVAIDQAHFRDYPGLENLQAALAQIPANPFKASSESVKAIDTLLRDFHARSRQAIATKLQESLASDDHGFVSRIFSDLPHPYLRGKETMELSRQYRHLVKDLASEFKKLHLSDEDFISRDKEDKKANGYNKAEAAFASWVDQIVARGRRELFDRDGAVNPEIIYLLAETIAPTSEQVRKVVMQFDRDTVKQGLLSAYVGLVMQEITRSIPDAFMMAIPNMVGRALSQIYKARTVYHPIFQLKSSLDTLAHAHQEKVLASPSKAEEKQAEIKEVEESKLQVLEFVQELSVMLQMVFQQVEIDIGNKLKNAGLDPGAVKTFPDKDFNRLLKKHKTAITAAEVDCYRACQDMLVGLGGMAYRHNERLDFPGLMAELQVYYKQLEDMPRVNSRGRSIFAVVTRGAAESSPEQAIQAILKQFEVAGVTRYFPEHTRVVLHKPGQSK